jgi:hypothetical protein
MSIHTSYSWRKLLPPLLLLLLQTATLTQAFTIKGLLIPITRHLYSTIHVPETQNDISSSLKGSRAASASASAAALDGEESAFVLDTETRRKKRLDRLNQKPRSNKASVPSLGIQFMEPKRQLTKLEKDKEIQTQTKESNALGEKFLADVNQHNSILSDAPAILLESGAGTGKTTVLAGRIAHLLRRNEVEPKNMIILSFTRRDAEALKVKAVEMIYDGNDGDGDGDGDASSDAMPIPARETIEGKLWCGTIHSFAINILRKYNCNDGPLRIISTKEMKNRVRSCLGRINSVDKNGKESGNGSDKDRLMMYRAGLEDSKQSIGTLVHYIVRCLELWKEAGMLSTPYSYSIKFHGVNHGDGIGSSLSPDDYVELAMRLGIPQHAALLALDISGDFQVRIA